MTWCGLAPLRHLREPPGSVVAVGVGDASASQFRRDAQGLKDRLPLHRVEPHRALAGDAGAVGYPGRGWVGRSWSW
jgi:hypothetical protein